MCGLLTLLMFMSFGFRSDDDNPCIFNVIYLDLKKLINYFTLSQKIEVFRRFKLNISLYHFFNASNFFMFLVLTKMK